MQLLQNNNTKVPASLKKCGVNQKVSKQSKHCALLICAASDFILWLIMLGENRGHIRCFLSASEGSRWSASSHSFFKTQLF